MPADGRGAVARAAAVAGDSRLDRDTIRTWIVEPQKLNPRVRKRGFADLSPEDLDGLVTYILSLKERR